MSTVERKTLARLKKWLELYRRLPKLTRNRGQKSIAIFTGQLAAGGVERVLLNILEGLPKEKFSITIYITDFNNNTWKNRFESFGKVILINEVLDWQSDDNLVKNYLELSLLFTKPDVIFITNSTSGYRSLSRTVPILKLVKRTRVYDLLHTHGRPQDDDAFLKISFPFDKFITKRIVINNYLKNYLISNYSIQPSRVQVIYNGLKTTSIKPDIENGKKDLQLKVDEKAITYVGRLQSDKSPLRLIELAYRLKDTLKKYGAFFAIVGEGELQEDMMKLTKKYNLDDSAVRFIGYKDNPHDIMAASQFTILTSDLEGVPMSILESMHIGTPAIAPAVGGIPEIINDSSSGFLANFESKQSEEDKIKSLAEAVERALLLTPEQLLTMKEHAMLDIKERFTNMESEYLELFSEK